MLRRAAPRNDRTIVTTINPIVCNLTRSVLFAVYDFLERIGFRWLHPGPDGERVPRLKTVPLADHAGYLADQLLLGRGLSRSEAEKEVANDRMTEFFVKRVRDAEFPIDSQYHGKAFLLRKPARKLLGEN